MGPPTGDFQPSPASSAPLEEPPVLRPPHRPSRVVARLSPLPIMSPAPAARPASGDVLLLVGTTKGAFLIRSDRTRRQWTVDGPHFPGEAVYSVAFDQRGGRTRT